MQQRNFTLHPHAHALCALAELPLLRCVTFQVEAVPYREQREAVRKHVGGQLLHMAKVLHEALHKASKRVCGVGAV